MRASTPDFIDRTLSIIWNEPKSIILEEEEDKHKVKVLSFNDNDMEEEKLIEPSSSSKVKFEESGTLLHPPSIKKYIRNQRSKTILLDGRRIFEF